MINIVTFSLPSLLVILTTALAIKPEIFQPTDKSVSLPVGSHLTITCKSEDSDTVVWIHNGVELSSSLHATFSEDPSKGSFSLELKNILKSNDGEYSCRNPNGETSDVLTITLVEEGNKKKGANLVTVDQRGKSYAFNCTHEAVDGDVTWTFNGDIREDKKSNQYKIEKLDFADHLGNYTCSYMKDGEVKNNTIELESEPYGEVPERKNLVEGDPLQLTCQTEGLPVPTIQWYRNGQLLTTADSRITFPAGKGGDEPENATIRIVGSTFDDAGKYECIVFNKNGNSTDTVEVSIKDKLAALWPFLGICAEVAILCTIIFIYERRRGKKQQEESEKEKEAVNNKDEKQSLNANNDVNDDVRQRNSKA